MLGNVRLKYMGVQAIVNGHDGDETTPLILSISLNVLWYMHTLLLIHVDKF